jgi:hypothetical protein
MESLVLTTYIRSGGGFVVSIFAFQSKFILGAEVSVNLDRRWLTKAEVLP